MTEIKKQDNQRCNECEYFLRMYKGAGVGTCKKGSKKYRSEDSDCDFIEKVDISEEAAELSGNICFKCGEEIIEHDFSKEHSIGSFDSQGKIVHYYCTECWSVIDQEREVVRKQFDIE
jgi:DNA-directed RNA polymerase subunit RPC12/RpoP